MATPERRRDEESTRAHNQVVLDRIVSRTGAPAVEHYRQVYDALGWEWPGDEEIRRRHRVASATR